MSEAAKVLFETLRRLLTVEQLANVEIVDLLPAEQGSSAEAL